MEIRDISTPRLIAREAPHQDDRGIFARLIESPSDFATNQVNVSINPRKGTLRGLHLLRGCHSENKKITVLQGEILDIVLNVDFKSNEYGSIYEYKLSQNSESLWIPPLHAHGFLTTSPHTVVAYQVDKPYVPHADVGVSINGLKFRNLNFSDVSIISSKDRNLPEFEKHSDMGFSRCIFC